MNGTLFVNDMMWELTESTNENVASVARKWFKYPDRRDELRRDFGGFMEAVASGDVFEAWLKADGHNRRCISKLLRRYDVYADTYVLDERAGVVARREDV